MDQRTGSVLLLAISNRSKCTSYLTHVGKISQAVHQTSGLGASSCVMLFHGFLWVTVFPEKAGTARETMEITDEKVSFSGLHHS